MQIIVERVEEDYLVVELENGNAIDIPRELIKEAKENDVIDIFINEEATKERKQEVKKLIDELFVD